EGPPLMQRGSAQGSFLINRVLPLWPLCCACSKGLGSQTGVREVVQGVRGEKISAITENGRNSRNVPFETELQLSDGNIILCIKIAEIPHVFCPARLYF